MGPDVMVLVFRMLSFKPTISLSSFTFIKRLFSSSSLSAIRVVSSAYWYFSQKSWFQLVLPPAQCFSWCSAYKLNKHSHIQFFAILWFLCPWDSPGKNTGVSCHFLIQGIFPTQGSNPVIPHYRQILYHLSHQGSPFSQVPTLLCPWGKGWYKIHPCML